MCLYTTVFCIFIDIKELRLVVLSQSSMKAVFTPADYPSNTAVQSYVLICFDGNSKDGECYANVTGSEIACEISGLKASTFYVCLGAACLMPNGDCGSLIEASVSTAPEGKVSF